MAFNELCEQNNVVLTLKCVKNYHYHLKGKRLISYWPRSNKRKVLAHDGSHEKCADMSNLDAIRFANCEYTREEPVTMNKSDLELLLSSSDNAKLVNSIRKRYLK